MKRKEVPKLNIPAPKRPAVPLLHKAKVTATTTASARAEALPTPSNSSKLYRPVNRARTPILTTRYHEIMRDLRLGRNAPAARARPAPPGSVRGRTYRSSHSPLKSHAEPFRPARLNASLCLPPAYHKRPKSTDFALPAREPRNLSVSFRESQQRAPETLRYSFGVRTRSGICPGSASKVNQDRQFVLENVDGLQHLSCFGVCDGHGKHGHLVAGFVCQRFSIYFEQRVAAARQGARRWLAEQLGAEEVVRLAREALRQTVAELEANAEIDTVHSGSTFTLVVVFKKELMVLNVGDSRAVMFVEEKPTSRPRRVVALTQDHRPEDPREQSRILGAGGEVRPALDAAGNDEGPLRVWLPRQNLPGLAMTRSIGDRVAAGVGVIATPTVEHFRVAEFLTASKGVCRSRLVSLLFGCSFREFEAALLVASDGVWDVLSNEQVLEVLAGRWGDGHLEELCDALMARVVAAWDRFAEGVDDITFVLIFLRL